MKYKLKYFDLLFLSLGILGWSLILMLVCLGLLNNGSLHLTFNTYNEMIIEVIGVSIVFVFMIVYSIKKIWGLNGE